MGSRLYVEVLDYAPTTLTHREKLALSVLADDARDSTRITWSSVESEKILRRAQVTRPQLYEVIKALVKKGVLEKVTAGQKNGTAKYRILPLQCPVIPDAEATEDHAQGPDSADTDGSHRPGTPDPGPGLEGPGFPDTDPAQSPDSADTDTETQCPEKPDTDESQCPETPDVSVRESRTPTLSPLSTRPLSFGEPSPSADDQDDAPDEVIDAEPVDDDQAVDSEAPVTAQTIVGEWLDRCAARPPSAVVGQMSKQIRVLLDEDRIHPDHVRRGIAHWMRKGLHPSTLPSVVNEVMNTTAGPGAFTNGHQPAGESQFDRARARAAARAAARQEGAAP
ncbi:MULTISPECIES: hypothetical protein [unclassified Streptomyces]|uniref:hypothetical protein n=1 Tax=unclassified Streptomyces TaxID=2593676 RepID=UPI00190B9DAB|nr:MULTISPECIES: hypothetical protein [unclassified Streptomyces]MBK3563191.1 hypothetical protein [Streptomyces sp. MBT62]MBK6013180.1 hypothetical protein [Streptomyces sp. MBT53]